MKLKALILFVIGFFYIFSNVYAQNTYTVQGSVIDSLSNQPVENAQVWMYGKQIGDVTDTLGQFKFNVFKMHSQTRVYVRVCGEEIATSKLVSFRADTLIQTEFYVNGAHTNCPSPPNIPWKVNPSEPVNYEGHIFLSRGGEFFKACNGDPYSTVWPEDLKRDELWPENSQLGDSLFIQIKGRLDPYSKGIIPFQNLYVGEIVLIREPNSNDCATK